MIRKYKESDLQNIFSYISKDYARNYFIALGLIKRNVFKDIYIQEVENDIKAVLFHRKSGNLQFCSYGDYDNKAFIDIIRLLDFKYLISPKSFCNKLESALLIDKKGALISVLKEEYFIKHKYSVDELSINDLDEVISLYKDNFSGYPNKEFMIEKLLSKRGRGVCIKKSGKIVSVAQTEFETNFNALIVGVTTNIAYQNKGFASMCVRALVDKLLLENKSIYLQYDNPNAGKIYEKIGFREIDQVYHYKKG